MPYTLTPEDLLSVTDVEAAFGTVRFLPEVEDIPTEFWSGNLYTELVSALFYGRALPACDIEMLPGFSPEPIHKAVHAHLVSFEPEHNHKIAGVGFLVSKAMTLTRKG